MADVVQEHLTPPRATDWRTRAVIVVVIGLAIRLGLSAVSIGTNDAHTWMRFGEMASRLGLAEPYVREPLLNHPLPTLSWAWFSYAASGGVLRQFAFLMRLPAIVADVASCALLWRILRDRSGRLAFQAVAVFALSPVAILLSAYHCNTDSEYACLALLSLHLATRRRPFLAGLAMAAALNVKLIPVLLVPGLFLTSRTPRDAVRFAAGLSLVVVPFIVPAILSGGAIITNQTGYDSDLQFWGVVGAKLLYDDFRSAWQYYIYTGRPSMFAAIGLATVWAAYHRLDALAMGTAVSAAFLVFTPGFGIQYLIFPSLLVLTQGGRLGFYFHAAASVFAASVYYICLEHGVPAQSIFLGFFPALSAWLGIVPWLLLVPVALAALRRPSLRGVAETTPTERKDASTPLDRAAMDAPD